MKRVAAIFAAALLVIALSACRQILDSSTTTSNAWDTATWDEATWQ